MATLILNAGTAAPINLTVQSAGENAPIEAGGVFPSFNLVDRSTVRGVKRTFGALTSKVDGVTKDSIISLLKWGKQIPCSGDLLGNIQTQCTLRYTGARMVPEASDLWEVGLTGNEVQPSVTLLRYSPGDTITGEAFTRSTTARQCDANGVYQSVAINTKRDGHYISGVRSLLLEDTRTNVGLWSRDLTNGVWAGSGTGSVAFNAIGLDGTAASATTITDSDAAAFYNRTQSVAVANDTGTHCVALWVRKDAIVARFVGFDATLTGGTGVGRFLMLNTTTGALTTYSASTGSGSHRVVDAVLWWIVEATVTNNTTGNVLLHATVYPAIGSVFGTAAAATTGACVVGQVQFELYSPFYSSPIFTTVAGVPRGADAYALPGPPPQESSFYVKFVEAGDIGNSTAARVVTIGAATETNPTFIVYASGATDYAAYHHNGTTSAQATLAVAPAGGSTVELTPRLFGDGSVDITQSINSAAATSAAQTQANALPTAWSGQNCWLNSSGGAGTTGFIAIQSLKIVAGARSLTEMRAA